MDREIKFRVYDTFDKAMWYPDTFFKFCRGVPSNWKQCYKLMQYIGLLDKYGKEIYEGDIVKEIPNGHISQIEWDSLGFRMNPEYEPKSLWELAINNRIKVIGNIYENPELLKEAGK